MRKSRLLILLAVVVTLVVPAVGGAASTVGSFEIDGNTPDDSGPGEPIDWDSPPPNLVTFTDPSGQSDNTFGSGSKENTPNEWDFVISSAAGKADITSGAIAFREIGVDTFVYVDFTRAAQTGDTFTNFEFNQSSATYVNSIGETVPVRTAGDLMIAVFVIQGGQDRTVDLRQWVGDQFSGFWDPLGSGVQGTDWDVAVNADANGRWTFAEAAIRLTAFFDLGCPGFGKGWIKTTSSQKFDSASLQDHTVRQDLNLSNCASKTFNFSFSPSPIAGTKVFAVYTPSDGVERELELTDPDADGTFSATDSQVPPGTLNFRFEVRNDADGDGQFDDLVWASAQGSETLVENESVTNNGSLAYEVVLKPESAENFSNASHVLTATVREVGTNVPLVGVTVSFAAESASPTGCASVSPASDVTDANGQATTTLTNNDPTKGCSASVRAWVDAAGGSSGFDQNEASDTASKVFVAYAVSVSPSSATNVAGSNHTFIVTLTRDTGSGPAGYNGQTVHLTLNAGSTDAHFVSINGDPASGTEADCTTQNDPVEGDGTCKVVVTSSSTGSISLSASFTTLNDSGQGTFSSSGGKLFVDYRVTVTPASATNEVGDPHTLIVLVEKDEGSGFAPASGVDVTLTLDQGGSDAQFVSINGDPASGTSGTCTTRADGTCEVVIVASTPGTATLNASIGIELDSGTLERSDEGSKLFSDFNLTVTPGSATNEVGQEHTFTVTLTRNDGGGFAGYAGQPVTLTLNAGSTDAHFVSINGDPASGTGPVSCTTQVDGTCAVVVVSTLPGPISLSASWQEQLSATSTATRAAAADKVYILAAALKLACPAGHASPGGHVDYTLQVSVEGTDLHNATLVDHLPDEFVYEGASPAPDSEPPVGGNDGDVVWDLGTVPAGSSPTFTISGHIDPATGEQANAHNEAVFDGDEIAPKIATHDLLVTNEGASADGRAFGLEFSLLGGTLTRAADPDTDGTNPDQELAIDVPGLLHDDLLTVVNSSSVTGTGASDEAIATTNSLLVTVPGVTVSAKSVLARSESHATGTSAGSSRGGSKIQDLVINGTKYGDVTDPKTIEVKDPLSGAVLAVVRLLNTTTTGAAGGVTQPEAGFFSSSLAINGIEVTTPGLPPALTSSITVAHAESEATFPDGRACGAVSASVAGDAYVLNVFNLSPDAGSGLVGLVTLPSTGGSDHASVADTTPIGTVTGVTHTKGTLTPLEASSFAIVNDLNVASGTITAKTVRAESKTTGATATGETIIEDLDIAGTDVCSTLGLTSICKPGENQILVLDGGNVIVLLNERIGSLRVNAVHIFVIGRGNPLGLPAGAEIIISSAFSDTSA